MSFVLENFIDVMAEAGFEPYEPILNASIQAGLVDDRIGSIVGGMGCIAIGISYIGRSQISGLIKSIWSNPKNLVESVKEKKSTSDLKIGLATMGVISTCYGVYCVASGVLGFIPQDSNFSINNINIPGSQSGNTGSCDGRTVLQVLKQRTTPFVVFDEKKFEPYYVHGGTCTAMSLDVAAKTETFCGALDDADVLVLTKCMRQMASSYRFSNREFRSRQSAFNAIAVDPNASDPSLAKIEALASFHHLKVNYPIPKQEIKEASMACFDTILNEINRMAPGMYFVRNLKHEQNRKLERYGHSTLILKAKVGAIYYDPNKGFNGMMGPEIGNDIVNRFLKLDIEKYDLDCPRLYSISCDPDCANIT